MNDREYSVLCGLRWVGVHAGVTFHRQRKRARADPHTQIPTRTSAISVMYSPTARERVHQTRGCKRKVLHAPPGRKRASESESANS